MIPIVPHASFTFHQHSSRSLPQVFNATSVYQHLPPIPFTSANHAPPHPNVDLVKFIESALKFDTLSKLSAPVQKPRLLNSGQEGFQTSEVLVRTKCDMHTYLRLVSTFRQRLSGVSPSSSTADAATNQSYRFNPSSQSFINPSRATQSLSFDFNHLQSLLLCLYIKDAADHVMAGIRSSKRKGNGMIRLLGTSCVVTVKSTSTSPSPIDIDCIMPYSSHTSIQLERLQSVLRAVI